MKKAPLFASAALVAFAYSAQAQEVTIIDNPDYAQAVADHISKSCPATEVEGKNPKIITDCIAAGSTMSMTVATDMSKYIADNAENLSTFWAGAAQGDILANCAVPMDRLSEIGTTTLGDYLEESFNAVKSCEESMVRAGEAVGINFQPTARNTVSCHMNKFKGLDCQY